MVNRSVLETLLIPVDVTRESEVAYSHARAVAMPGSKMILGRVVPKADDPALTTEVATAIDAASAMASSAELRATAERLDPSGRLETEVIVDRPVEGIVHLAERLHATMIVAATHGRGSIGRWFFGSVTDRLTRVTTIPLLLIRSARVEGRTYKRLIVPLDGSEIAETAIPVAAEIARAHQLPVHLVTAIDTGQLAVMTAPLPTGGTPAGIVPELWDVLKEGADEALRHGASNATLSGLTVTSETRIGAPFAVIEEATGPDDLIVLTSHGRSGFQRLMLGSVAEHVVRFAEGPVVLVPHSTVERSKA